MTSSISEPLRIGDLAQADVESAVALWDQAGLLRPWNDPRADIARALATPTSTVLAGYLEDKLAATVMVGWDGHRGWIYYLAVAEGRRRAGLGGRMLKAAEGWLSARGAPKLNLMIRTENLAVRAFYESLGYRVSDAIVMQRELR
jgi:ribosomal protein S18 acetylase RimI-like enzyme